MTTRKWRIHAIRDLPAARCVVSVGVLLSSAALAAADPVSLTDLQATARSLGFVDSLSHDGTIVVGFVYASESDPGKQLASALADRLRAIPGPNSAKFRTEIVTAGELGGFSSRLDAVFLTPGMSPEAKAIGDAIRQRHLVSISNDPACLAAKSCVLMIRTDRGVEINLDTALADAVGARFSPVFSMMVKRR